MKSVCSVFLVLFCLGWCSSCAYLGTAARQAVFVMQYELQPGQRVFKHMLTTDTFFVFGLITQGSGLNDDALAVIALSDSHQPGEVVDVSSFSRFSALYGLNLPAGNYSLLVVSDLNRDGFFDNQEIVGGRDVVLDSTLQEEKVLDHFDINLNRHLITRAFPALRIPVPVREPLAESLFYPKGSIRTLDDPLFAPRMASLGMYEPAAFLEEAPMMFYALEEDLGFKVPVVFVHGINGSITDFREILARLDRRRYKAWFFFYPSGNDLEQLSEMFYKIFLSGKTIPLGEMPLAIVAHSMGGLVVRDALNRMTGAEGENRVSLLVTVASPFGGHPAAAMSEDGLVDIPSWQDVAPGSDFMTHLRRKKLPETLENCLLYAFANESAIKIGENSDGVVPLSSQLCQEAQDESTVQYGFNDSHTGVLKNPEAIGRIVSLVESVKAPIPDDHMRELDKGGYTILLDDSSPPLERYLVRSIGYWLDALAQGAIAPRNDIEEHFVKAIRGEIKADTPVERAWLRVMAEYPLRAGS